MRTGPALDKNNAALSVNMLLKKNGYSDIDVTGSDITVRLQAGLPKPNGDFFRPGAVPKPARVARVELRPPAVRLKYRAGEGNHPKRHYTEQKSVHDQNEYPPRTPVAEASHLPNRISTVFSDLKGRLSKRVWQKG